MFYFVCIPKNVAFYVFYNKYYLKKWNPEQSQSEEIIMYSLLSRHLYQRSSCQKLIFRSWHGHGHGSHNNGQHQAKEKVFQFFNKVMDNPLPLGVGALVVGILQLRRIRERESRKSESSGCSDVQLADPWQVTSYQSLPLRHVSR